MQQRTLYGDIVIFINWILSKFKKQKSQNINFTNNNCFYADIALCGADVTVKLNDELAGTIRAIHWNKKDKDDFKLTMIEILLDREFDRRHVTKIELIYKHEKGTTFSKTFTVKYVGEFGGVSIDDLVLEKTTVFEVTRTKHVFTEVKHEGDKE